MKTGTNKIEGNKTKPFAPNFVTRWHTYYDQNICTPENFIQCKNGRLAAF